jgi:hypothetical protein
MKWLVASSLALFLVASLTPEAFAWRGGGGVYHGPAGGTAVRGPYGGAAVRGGDLRPRPAGVCAASMRLP